MRDLVTTNDPVLLSYLQVLLRGRRHRGERVRRQHERRAGHARRRPAAARGGRRRLGAGAPPARRGRARPVDRPVMSEAHDSARSRHAPTDDAFLGGALNILQPRTGYRAGLDAVMLAAAVSGRGEPRARTGCWRRRRDRGAVPRPARRRSAERRALLEREPQLAALAAENIVAQRSRRRACASIDGDVGACGAAICARLGLDRGELRSRYRQSAVPRHRRPAPSARRAEGGAHAMPDGELEHWARFMARMAAPGRRRRR